MTKKFNINRSARAVVRVTDLEAARNFYVNALGFIETEADDEHIYLRGLEEQSHHCYVLKKAKTSGVEAISYKVSKEKDLDELAEFFSKKELPIKWMENGSQHAIGRAHRGNDITGIRGEFLYKIAMAERAMT